MRLSDGSACPEAARPLYFEQGRWLVCGHQAVSSLLRDPRLLSCPPGLARRSREGSVLPSIHALLAHQMLFLDGEEHARARMGIRAALVQLARRQETRQAIADRIEVLLTASRDRDTLDLVADLARPLAAWTAARVLGVSLSEEHLRQWAAWSDSFADLTSGVADGDRQAVYQFHQVLLTLGTAACTRAAHAPEPLLAVLKRCVPAGHPVAVNAQMLFAAGRVTVEQCLAQGICWLTAHPQQWKRLREQRQRAPGVSGLLAEEWLRMVSPTRVVKRWSAQEIECSAWCAGESPRWIRQGQEVAFSLEAANHDPTVFADPHACSLQRRPNPHLAFGAGAHLCPGASLARLEVSLVLDALLNRDAPLFVALEDPRAHMAPHATLRSMRAYLVGVATPEREHIDV